MNSLHPNCPPLVTSTSRSFKPQWDLRSPRAVASPVMLWAILLFLLPLGTAMAQTTTFNYTGGPQTYTVPPGVTSVSVDVYGAAGFGLLGYGGRVQADFPVTPGEVLNIYVGGQGTETTGGYNGGGDAGTNSGYASGGGASDIRRAGTGLANRIIVAGGGGGSGSNCGTWTAEGGHGGGLVGGSGCAFFCSDCQYTGAGGTQSAGGIAGPTGHGSCGGNQNGSLGQGGSNTLNGFGTGGGGGYYGGGSGCFEGAGGGSSYTYPSATNVIHTQGARQGNGLITITPLVVVSPCATPSNVTATPSSVCVGSFAQLNATSTGNSISWYTVPSGGSPIGTSASGANFGVGPASTTTYYAEANGISGGPGSQIFNYTGGLQTFTVPLGVTSVTLDVRGAQGQNQSPGGTGGLGGTAVGDLAVTPGQTLYIYVGGQNGYNGGGTGGINGNDGASGPLGFAGSGGGASDVRVGGTALANRVIVAGGGGGAGHNGTWSGCQVAGPAGNGGAGGGTTGGTGGVGVGTPCNCAGGGGAGGTGGTQGAGGSPGAYAGNTACLRAGYTTGVAGTLGQGGNGSGTYYNGTGGGGGGGGGYYGGGPGGSGSDTTPGGGGGGGSSYIGGVTGGTTASGTQSGNGVVTVSWTAATCTSSPRTPVTVTVASNPTTANAGTNQTLCGTSATLAANTPSSGTGSWSIISGAAGNVISPNSPTSAFTGISGTTYTLRWTISNAPCAASTDDVIIQFVPNPTPANAGPNQNICGTSATLAANSPLIGTGAWSIVSGAGGTVTTPTSPTSTFTGVQGTSYTLRWTTSNAPCASSTDDVIINFISNPTPANAGPDQTLCATTTTMAANAPSVGGGTWSIVSGAGGSFGSFASPTASFTGLSGTTYTLRWTTSNAPCPTSTDDVVVTFTPNPNPANAGADQSICGSSTTLAGNTPSVGTGGWSIISGTGGSITTPTSAASGFTGIQGNTYILRWTIANPPCANSTDDVVITMVANPTPANAGPDQTVCSSSTTLAANTPSAGTGAWSIVSGTGGTVTTASSPTSTFSGVQGNTYTLRWTTTNVPCATSSDDVVITFTATTTVANAGPNQSICGNAATLAANTPTTGVGSWSIISGTGGNVTSTANPASTFTGVQGTTYTLRWTVTNPPCAPTTDDVIISFVSNPTAANAGPDQTLCASTTNLAANTPTSGIGAWSIVSGTGGSVLTPASATSVFNGVQGNTYTLRWTVSNAPCAPTTDDVVITFTPTPTTANAGPDQTICTTSTPLAANTAAIGTGAWSIVSGAGGTVTAPSNPTSSFTGVQGNTYTLRWTISNAPCTATTDDVVITITNNPTTANAGPDQVLCATSTSLAANNPTVGTAAWSIVSGAGGVINNPTSPTSGFTGTSGVAYTLRWTISNPPCAPSTDDVQVYFTPPTTTANAGPDQTLCATTATLSSNTPTSGVGAWSIVSGAGGTVVTPTSPNSNFTGVPGTTYTLRWTISNAPCTASTDDVVITLTSNPAVANAGPDQTICATSTTLAATAPSIGTGAWSIVSGTGGVVVTPSNAASTFTGVTGTTYTLRWTVTNPPCAPTTDDVVITMVPVTTVANAGPDQLLCSTSTTLAGNQPTVGTGNWSIVSGTGGTIVNPALRNSAFTLTPGVVYTLRWTISNPPCPSNFDDVQLVTDNVLPTITCPANIVSPSNQLQCAATVTYTAPVGADNCSNPSTTQIAGFPSGGTFPSGITTNTFRVTDAFGNSATCSFTVTVTDAQSPTITCPANITAFTDLALCTATRTYNTPVGTDNCPNAVTTLSSGLSSGSAFPLGVTTNVFLVTDAGGNTATCSFTVTVTDNENPAIICPANVVANTANGLCGQSVTYGSPVVTDNCTGATATLLQGNPSGASFPVGVTNVVFRATDGASNASTCGFTVTVVDGEAPTITCPTNIVTSNAPSTCSAIVSYTSPTGSDNCAGFTTTRLSGLASGASFPVGTTTTVYRITDASSNSATCSFDVTVNDTEAPTAICQNITLQLDSSGNGTIDPAMLNNGSTDNCSALTSTASPVTFSCTDLGQNNVTLTVADQNGNSSTCVANVTVTAAAVSVSFNTTVYSCGYNTSCFAASDGVTTAAGSGGCPGYTYQWSNGQTTATATGLGGGTHTVTVTDASGGTTVSTVTLTAPPPFVLTTNATSSCAESSTGTITTTSVGGNDCNPHTYAWSNGVTTASQTGLAPGIYNLTVTDGGGCTVTRSITVGTLAAPGPAFTQSGNTLTSTQTWASYQWLLNGSNIPGANGSSYTVTQSGNYSLSVTNGDGCTGVSASENITFVGMSDPANSWAGLSIYPNPTRDAFNLRTEAPIPYGFTVTITDMFGRKMSSQTFSHLSHEQAFVTKDFAAGTYFVEVSSAKGLHKTFKLVVQ